MTDLVENLRLLAACKHSDQSIGAEAADEIERLRAQVAMLRWALLVAETHVDIAYNETGREEAGEVKRDLDKVRNVLKDTEK